MTGIGLQRSGKSPSHSSDSLISQGRLHSSPPSPTPFPPSREGKDRLPGSQGVSLTESEGETDSTQVEIRQQRQRPRQRQQMSGLKSSCRVFKTGVPLSEKTRPAMSVTDYNKAQLSRPGSVYSLKVSF